jgi:CheY-like chemotaxis protein
MKLMIVEDNSEFRKILKKIFAGYFSEVFETDDGEEAIQNYEKYKPDWVFMDIGIKKLDGIVATRRIVNKHPKAMIVMVSQYNNPRIINASLKAGAFDYVTKDDISKLIKIIK